MSEPTPIQKKNMHAWPGIARVAKLLNRSVKAVNKLIDDGDLVAYPLPDGQRRFDPTQVDTLVTEFRDIPDDDENDLSLLAAKTRNESMLLSTMLEFIKEVRGERKETHEHNIELQRQANQSAKITNEAKDQTIQFLQTRVSELEHTQLDFFKATQDMLDSREERQIAHDRAHARNQITQDIWQTTKANFGTLVEMAMKKWGIDGGTMEQIQAAGKLLQSIQQTPARLEALIETGLVSDEETALIKIILGDKSTPTPASSTQEAKPTETTGTKTTIDVAAESSEATAPKATTQPTGETQ